VSCNGEGTVQDEECQRCEGEGRIDVETTKRKVRGKAGEAMFLRQYKDAIVEAAKLENVYPQKAKSLKASQSIINAAVFGGKNGNRFEGAKPEDILDAKVALEKLKKGTMPKQITDGTKEMEVIDLEDMDDEQDTKGTGEG
jgi:DnaJ-class molecular chaperone